MTQANDPVYILIAATHPPPAEYLRNMAAVLQPMLPAEAELHPLEDSGHCLLNTYVAKNEDELDHFRKALREIQETHPTLAMTSTKQAGMYRTALRSASTRCGWA